MKRLALLGASGHGKVVADAALAGGWGAVEFFDDAWPQRQSNGPWPVTGDSAALLTRLQEFQGVIVSIGDCAVRWAKHQTLETAGAPLVTVVHPAAVVSPHALLGAGTVLMAGAVVNIDAVVGQAGIINTGATVDHDCRLGDAVHICPGAHLSGHVQVGHGSWVGVGAAVKQGMTIGQRVMVGAGAVVVQAVPDGLTVIGNPAVPMGTRET
ncbi:MAG: acetyltransferase [Hylemonella sp.]|uniref:acetyltransferase n=1 Tax=Hylemonella sp. TaxID=2066020 RepID=UPI0022C0D3FE|nr:acetyltransferase [Hylemonella sp.]MCZ8253494.1 acetyltransferase [Hylemonella sp.]